MDIEDVLLTVYEINKHFNEPRATQYELQKKQCMKLLKVLEDDGWLEHKTTQSGFCWSDCPTCKLKKDLEGNR